MALPIAEVATCAPLALFLFGREFAYVLLVGLPVAPGFTHPLEHRRWHHLERYDQITLDRPLRKKLRVMLAPYVEDGRSVSEGGAEDA